MLKIVNYNNGYLGGGCLSCYMIYYCKHTEVTNVHITGPILQQTRLVINVNTHETKQQFYIGLYKYFSIDWLIRLSCKVDQFHLYC